MPTTPLISVVLPSHLKPLIVDSIECLLAQTMPDWNCTIYDAGHWLDDPTSPMHAIYDQYKSIDPRIEWVITHDPLDFAEQYCPISYRYNQAHREGKLTGRYSMVLPDDDLIDPSYMEVAAKHLETNRYDAVYSTQEWVSYKDGQTKPIRLLHASQTLRSDCVGRVDLLQVVWRTEALKRLEQPYFPESPDPASCRIQDGLFLNKLCTVIDGIHPIPQVLSTHRFTPHSTYTPI